MPKFKHATAGKIPPSARGNRNAIQPPKDYIVWTIQKEGNWNSSIVQKLISEFVGIQIGETKNKSAIPNPERRRAEQERDTIGKVFILMHFNQ